MRSTRLSLINLLKSLLKQPLDIVIYQLKAGLHSSYIHKGHRADIEACPFNGVQAIKRSTLKTGSGCTRFDADNMTQIYQDLLTQAYSDFNKRDINAVLAAMHPQVEWANGMEGGYFYGHEAVRDYWTRQWNLVDPHVEPRSFQLDENQRIIVDVHQVVRDLAGNVLVDQSVQHLYTFEDGLIRRMDIQELPM